MTERRRGLGRGLGALIPSGPVEGTQRPVDVFFPDQVSSAIRTSTAHGTGAPLATASSTGDPDVTEHHLEGEATPDPGPGGMSPSEVSTDLPATGSVDGTPTHEARAEIQFPGSDDGELVPVPGARFAEIPVDAIAPNARQPRQVFDEDDLDELASSIREVGVLQPIVVRPIENPEDGPTYELIMGERRWRATRAAGLATVPAIVRLTAEGDMLRDALLENLHRVQLNPLEEAAAYQQLLEDFGCTHDELAARVARSRPQISNTIRLLKLPPLVQRRVAAGVLSAGHARALLGLRDGAAMERLAQRIVAEGLSVRATEEIVTVGEDPMQPEMRRRPRSGEHAPALGELADRLADRFDTKVRISLGQRKGSIGIDFATLQDLNRILDVLSPGDPGVYRSSDGAFE
jgi:ParB family chromosome partitioning protein